MSNSTTNQVTIVDIKMPFMSMVVFMIKAAIAAIPAFIVLAIIGMIISGIMGAIVGDGAMMMSH